MQLGTQLLVRGLEGAVLEVSMNQLGSSISELSIPPNSVIKALLFDEGALTAAASLSTLESLSAAITVILRTRG